MINLNKIIVRLLGSCLLCSVLTSINCNGCLSKEFYDSLSTYEGANGDAQAGWSGGPERNYGARYDTAWRKGDENRGKMSGWYQCGHTDDVKYSDTVCLEDTKNCCNDTNPSFNVNDVDGDFKKHENWFVPIWCNDQEHKEYGGNDLSNGYHNGGGIFIRGLECIAPSAVHASKSMPELTFKTVPVALDDYACTHVKDLETVVFDGEGTDTIIPYFLSQSAFPSSVKKIIFKHSSLKDIENYKPSKLDAFFKSTAKASKPTSTNSYQPQANHNLMKSSYWENIPKGDTEYELLKYFDKFRKRKIIWNPNNPQQKINVPWSHLWAKGPELTWTREDDDVEGALDLYWEKDYNSLWSQDPETIDETKGDDKKKIAEETKLNQSIPFYNVYRPLESDDLVDPRDLGNAIISIANDLAGSPQSQLSSSTKELNSSALPGNSSTNTGISTNPSLDSNTAVYSDNGFDATQDNLNDSALSENSTSGLSADYHPSLETSATDDGASTLELNSTPSGEIVSEEKNNSNSKTSSTVSSASTKTGYSTDMNLFLPMILSGGCALVLKKKKDD